ncbi:MAG: FAD-dependent oxidoreductase, partial [Erysipelotrichaceae bacterium]|nr:FAD-dependent oxidoreductase [Erysipelotrichaceae bacterium]
MKKFLKVSLACLLCLSVTACSQGTTEPAETPAEGTYTEGTYTGVSENGKGGTLKVDVTFSADAITAIEVGEHSETPGISDPAIEQIPAAIVESQSLGIDVVTGATITSDAIIEAVADAVTQAGGDAEALKKVEVAKEVSTEVVELETDVVVVGGGAAGLAATLRLTELGKKVILLEKAASLGGAIGVSGGNQVVSGSKLQAEAGVSDDTAQLMVDDFMKNGANLNVPELINLYAENVGETTDWLNEYVGIEYDMEGGLHKLGEYSIDRELAYAGGGNGFATTAREAIDKSGAEVYLNTKAESLTVEDGKVVGVTAVGADGTTYTIKSNEVVLATGGYGNNKDLLTDEMKSALYYGPSTSTGDGIIMATEAVDAATRLMEYGKRYPNGVEVDAGIAKSTIAGNIVGWTMSAILVNAEGERVVNEKASNRTILEVELEQTGGMLYLLLDSETFDVWKTKLAGAGLSEGDIAKYVENNGATTPIFATGETLADVAAVVGMDPATLEKTVETYNGYVEAGKDADFDRNPDFMTMPIGEGPYYLIEQKPRFATTMGGLVVNTNLQVLNNDGDVIEGLYAAGETVGGVMGDDSPSGANNGWALTSGKLAAEA